ncbi:MAG TPA: autotransporter domain-containing protein [Sphingomicrobium sp.]|nr:autotransporter domain-containing protein [Sphingomicrobium sp.]
MKTRYFARVLACASLLSIAGMPSAVAAQQISRIIVFGDSYADTGNALRLAGINPITTQIYTTGRFSGGSNYVDTLSSILQVPQFNFAVGGASTTGNGTPGLPGFPFEVQEFLSGGGTLGFPAVNTTLSRSDLVAISVGGNDSRYFQQGGGTVASAPAAAAAAVTSFQQNFDLVMQKGTPTISFLAGNAALLPEVATNPSAQAIRAAFSSAYNNGAQQVLAGYASRGSIVHYLDLTQVANNISANPGAYGIKGIVCPAIPDPTCIANSNAPYVFYVDNLHLTSAGFAIVGEYVARQLAAPLTLQAPSDMGLDVAQQWGRTLSSRSDLYGRGIGPEGIRLYALGDALQHDVSSSDTNSAFDVRTVGATVGAEYNVAGGTVGIAGNYSRPKVNFGNDAARIRGNSWQIGAYGSLSADGLFGEAYVGYGKDHDRISRAGVVQGMTARPSGSHTLAGAKGGYLMRLGPLDAGPIVALDYARAKVDAYTEAGDPALTLNVGRQSLRSFTGQAGVEVRGSLAGLRPFLDLTAERNFTSNDQLITFDETSAPVIVNSWAVRRGKETYGRLSAGASADLLSGLSVDVFASTTLGRDHGQELGGNVGVKARF